MTEELIILRRKLWDAIKAIDNAVASGLIDEVALSEPKPPTIATVESVLTEVCAYYGVSMEELTNIRRVGDYVKRRIVATRLIMEYTTATSQAAAEMLGYKQRGTVLHHLRNMDSVLKGETVDYNYSKRDYEAIKKRIEREVAAEAKG